MDFDKIGVQHVSKRRQPSPVNAKHQPSSVNSGYNQKISPRLGRLRTSSLFKKLLKRFFLNNSNLRKKNVTRDNLNPEVCKRKPASRSPGIGISGSTLKTVAVILKGDKKAY